MPEKRVITKTIFSFGEGNEYVHINVFFIEMIQCFGNASKI